MDSSSQGRDFVSEVHLYDNEYNNPRKCGEVKNKLGIFYSSTRQLLDIVSLFLLHYLVFLRTDKNFQPQSFDNYFSIGKKNPKG